MRRDPDFGGIAPALSAEQILDLAPNLHTLADIEMHSFGTHPGPHMTPSLMLELKDIVQTYADREDIFGIIITHGTDTLEETAYFLDCTLKTSKPVVIVGSMRNSSDFDWDGPRNLRDAVLIATNADARDKGVLVCFNETIHAASEVSKVDTSNLNTFESLNFGPMGRIASNTIYFYRDPVHRDYFETRFIPNFVPIIKTYTGQETFLLEKVIDHQPEGIIIEAMGVGNVPPPVAAELYRAIQQDIPVILVSRCPVGRVEHVYAYEGAGSELYDVGVIFVDYLNAQKARIKLIAALGAEEPPERLRAIFEWSKH